jgi:signal transduction histidine kinase
MNMTTQPDSRAGAREFAHWSSRSARTGSIRCATALARIVAFALLGPLSMRADAATAVDVGQGDSGVSLSNVAWHTSVGALFALAALLVVALGGWCRARIAFDRVIIRLVGVESEWQRRYAAVEAREQAAHALAAAHAEAAAGRERDRIQSAMRYFISGPLSALASLLGTLHSVALTPNERSLAGKIHLGMRTTLRALEDVLLSSHVESRAILLAENVVNVRELIEGVAALFAPTAARKGLHLSVSIDRSIDTRVLADSDRLGQMVFHMLSRAIRCGESSVITIVARAEWLNAGSQRISISVRHVASGETESASSLQEQFPWWFSTNAQSAEVCEDVESGLSLCRLLAQHMRGELTVENALGFGSRCTFSAPFTIESVHAPVSSANAQDSAAGFALAERQIAHSPQAATESFDRAYLEALSNEGIDLHTFVGSWCQSVQEDLQRMRGLRELPDAGALRGVLHRLSGAAGLVGARGLMEALQRSSVAQPEPEADALDMLEKRSEALMKQLCEAIDLHGSNLP